MNGNDNKGKAALNAATLEMLQSMKTLHILYDIGVQLHRPYVTKAIKSGRLVLEEGSITDLPGHKDYAECTIMAYVLYNGRKFGPFSAEDFPENAQSTVQIEAFLDLVEMVERETRRS